MSDYLEVAVAKALGGFRLDVDFHAGSGVTALFGRSGAGKSLTMLAIAGILTPDSGRISLAGEPLFDAAARINVPPQRRRVGLVPQEYALFPHLSVAENVGYGLAKLPRDERARRVAAILETVGLAGMAGRRPAQLSGGQQQRVALARALAISPCLLLLDEPFSSLDAGLRASLRQELRGIVARSGAATLLVTHDLDDAYALAERIVVLDRGRVLQQDDRDRVYHRPSSRTVAELMGIRNILEARVEAADSEGTMLDWEGRRLRAEAGGPPAGSRALVCIRATRVMIVPPERPGTAPAENRFTARIAGEEIRGEQRILQLKIAESPRPRDLEVELPGYVYYRLGLDSRKDVEIALRPEALHVIPHGG